MASLSSKRKAFTNRQLQRRDPRAKAAAPAPVTVPQQVEAVTAIAPSSTFDDSFYAALKPRFESALGNGDSADVKQVMRALVQQEFDAGGREGALSLRPYILKFVGERAGSARTSA